MKRQWWKLMSIWVLALMVAVPALAEESLVEGVCQPVFAQTEQERAQYIPQTGWREEEAKAEKINCGMSVYSVAGSITVEQAQAFIDGQETLLPLAEGDTIVLRLDGAYRLRDVQCTYMGGPLTLHATDAGGAYRFGESLELSSGQTEVTQQTLTSYIKLAAGADAEITAFSVSGIPALYTQIVAQMTEDPDVLDAHDPNNPVSIYLRPIKQSVYLLAEKLLNGHENLTAHEKIMVFMDYISEWNIGTDDGQTYLSLQSCTGACGEYSNILAALAVSVGIPGRLITLGNYPANDGHAVCELYHDGGWHLYDPTYGAYYTTADGQLTIDKPQTVLSFEQLQQGMGDSPQVTCIVTAPWRLTGAASYSFLGPAIYEKAWPKGVVGPDKPLIYPLTYVMGDTGKLNKDSFTAAYQGISYLGAGDRNQHHDWTVTNLISGNTYSFVIQGSFVGGEIGGDFMAYAVGTDANISAGKEHVFNNDNPDSLCWSIEFTAEAETVHLYLTHPYAGSLWHYISLESLELVEG